MSMTAALIFVVEAATSCAPAGQARLAGGAIVMSAVGTDEEIWFYDLGPTTDVRTKPSKVETGADSRHDDRSTERCAPAVFHIA